ncbi:hypothetical protein CRG98_025990 [Punica granatum]|uniref:Uncharacterized protein n=1 Tax=Punica granatum TaxID=22663 RepID=A0A2I0JBJ6_PUNGR|nr:hypothetical protein CRG98_025990 [Punica granatum]
MAAFSLVLDVWDKSSQKYGPIAVEEQKVNGYLNPNSINGCQNPKAVNGCQNPKAEGAGDTEVRVSAEELCNACKRSYFDSLSVGLRLCWGDVVAGATCCSSRDRGPCWLITSCEALRALNCRRAAWPLGNILLTCRRLASLLGGCLLICRSLLCLWGGVLIDLSWPILPLRRLLVDLLKACFTVRADYVASSVVGLAAGVAACWLAGGQPCRLGGFVLLEASVLWDWESKSVVVLIACGTCDPVIISKSQAYRDVLNDAIIALLVVQRARWLWTLLVRMTEMTYYSDLSANFNQGGSNVRRSPRLCWRELQPGMPQCTSWKYPLWVSDLRGGPGANVELGCPGLYCCVARGGCLVRSPSLIVFCASCMDPNVDSRRGPHVRFWIGGLGVSTFPGMLDGHA